LCQNGANLLLEEHELAALVAAQEPTVQPEERVGLAHLRGTLLSLAEIIHIGIPQYGREVHGPYPVGRDQFMIVRDYYDLIMPEV
jgi:hypothetical protein